MFTVFKHVKTSNGFVGVSNSTIFINCTKMYLILNPFSFESQAKIVVTSISQQKDTSTLLLIM